MSLTANTFNHWALSPAPWSLCLPMYSPIPLLSLFSYSCSATLLSPKLFLLCAYWYTSLSMKQCSFLKNDFSAPHQTVESLTWHSLIPSLASLNMPDNFQFFTVLVNFSAPTFPLDFIQNSDLSPSCHSLWSHIILSLLQFSTHTWKRWIKIFV